MDIQDWTTQLRRGVLEYCIMLMIKDKDMYGYDLIQNLNKWDVLAVKEGTIYPLLRRLEKDLFIKATWKSTEPGVPNRKYYELTEDGVEMLLLMDNQWGNLVNSIKDIKKRGQSI